MTKKDSKCATLNNLSTPFRHLAQAFTQRIRNVELVATSTHNKAICIE